jgi:hypothetical protein
MYFNSWIDPTGLTAGAPALSAQWDATGYTAGVGKRGLLRADPRSGLGVSTGVSGTKGVSTQPLNVPAYQFVSDPLPAGTLNGTFSIVVPAFESAATNDMWLQCTIRVISGNGTTIRGTAYTGQAQATPTGTLTDPQYEFPTNPGTPVFGQQRMLSGIALSSVSILAGDRIEVTLGARSSSTSTAINAFIYVTDADDVPDVDPMVGRQNIITPTSPGRFYRRPWIEFSADVYGALGIEEYRYMMSGVTLNSSPSLPFVDLTSVAGLDATPLRLSTHDREGLHGGYVSSEFESTRTVTLEGSIYANSATLEAYLDQLKANFAPTRRDRKLYFGTDQGTRIVFGKSQGLRYDKDSFRRLGIVPFQVQIVCQDPRIYAETETVDVRTFGTGGTAYQLTTGGNRDTPLRAHLAGPLTNPSVMLTHRYGQTTYAYTGTLSATDDLLIDFDKRTVMLNEITNVRVNLAITGAWSNVPPGEIVQVNLNTSSGGGQMLLAFRNAWT